MKRIMYWLHEKSAKKNSSTVRKSESVRSDKNEKTSSKIYSSKSFQGISASPGKVKKSPSLLSQGLPQENEITKSPRGLRFSFSKRSSVISLTEAEVLENEINEKFNLLLDIANIRNAAATDHSFSERQVIRNEEDKLNPEIIVIEKHQEEIKNKQKEINSLNIQMKLLKEEIRQMKENHYGTLDEHFRKTNELSQVRAALWQEIDDLNNQLEKLNSKEKLAKHAELKAAIASLDATIMDLNKRCEKSVKKRLKDHSQATIEDVEAESEKSLFSVLKISFHKYYQAKKKSDIPLPDNINQDNLIAIFKAYPETLDEFTNNPLFMSCIYNDGNQAWQDFYDTTIKLSSTLKPKVDADLKDYLNNVTVTITLIEFQSEIHKIAKLIEKMEEKQSKGSSKNKESQNKAKDIFSDIFNYTKVIANRNWQDKSASYKKKLGGLQEELKSLQVNATRAAEAYEKDPSRDNEYAKFCAYQDLNDKNQEHGQMQRFIDSQKHACQQDLKDTFTGVYNIFLKTRAKYKDSLSSTDKEMRNKNTDDYVDSYTSLVILIEEISNFLETQTEVKATLFKYPVEGKIYEDFKKKVTELLTECKKDLEISPEIPLSRPLYKIVH